MNDPTSITGTYRHYKGNGYKALGTGTHSETMETMVIYESLDRPSEVWLRPYDMFFETVTIDGQEIFRFEKIS